jgi:general secretion pathway protein K
MKSPNPRQSGAALLTAMLTVTLVASLAAGALWQQWKLVEVETAERSRLQMNWLLNGALDWARLILREDARAGGADHLAEPWAVALKESRLSSFLASDAADAEEVRNAFLSGQITDLQSRLNISNLLEGDQVSPIALASFRKLFELLGLPELELSALIQKLRQAQLRSDNTAAPLMPQRVEQLTWLGISSRSMQMLLPYITLLPERSAVNINTASAEVLCASIPGLELADAQRLVKDRSRSHFSTLPEVNRLLGAGVKPLDPAQHSVSTRFFEVRGRLRLDQLAVNSRSLVQRDGLEVKTLWRDHGVMRTTP